MAEAKRPKNYLFHPEWEKDYFLSAPIQDLLYLSHLKSQHGPAEEGQSGTAFHDSAQDSATLSESAGVEGSAGGAAVNFYQTQHHS